METDPEKMKKEIERIDFEIDKLMVERIDQNMRDLVSPQITPEHFERTYKLNAIVRRVIDEPDSMTRVRFIWDLPGLLENLSLTDYASFAFENIETGFQRKLAEISDTDSREYTSIQWNIEELRYAANEYLKYQAKQQIKSFDLSKQLTLVTENLLKLKENHVPYQYKAFTELKNEIEKEIQLKKEELANREHIEKLETKEIGKLESSKKQRVKGETFDRTCLFFYYLFECLQVQTKANVRAKILSDLTGFSENTIETFFRQPDLKATKNFTAYEKDIEYVQKAFKQLNLTEMERFTANALEETVRDLS